MKTTENVWNVQVSARIIRDIDFLPERVRKKIFALIRDIRISGPVRGNWPNYSKLGKNRHHCHLKKGKPTYVAVWEVKNKLIKLVNIEYVGTHEKAPY